MTRTDIIQAAFKVWGRELYKTTSLSDIARELKVSKPALYRHFKNKQELLDAMYGYYFDQYTGFVKEGFEKAIQTPDIMESMLILIRTLSEYYARHTDAFVFSLIRVYGSQDHGAMMEQLLSRGIDMRKLKRFEKYAAEYPSAIQLIVISMTFWNSHFCRFGKKAGEDPTEEAIQEVISSIEEKISAGLGLNKEQVEKLDFGRLEELVKSRKIEEADNGDLLKGVIAAVAEAGPWCVSMEMVARRSGLSKSSLYSHFKNKKDMIRQLFLTEFERIANHAKVGALLSAAPEEQFYLAIFSIADYLRSRPEILIAMDWLRTRKPEMGKPVPPRVFNIFSGIKIEALEQTADAEPPGADRTTQWILFLLVNTLMWWRRRLNLGSPQYDEKIQYDKAAFADLPDSSIRKLYRFLTLGIKGFQV
ncbi:MAG: TetR/AcrR family transcriptional regulator [Treponema sp.]|jgi:AcrR family transcriptional regulator|nr:TetR/AcrR family transcriptional regulator [Treponema sp.]